VISGLRFEGQVHALIIIETYIRKKFSSSFVNYAR
jgi:hypothetical protein